MAPKRNSDRIDAILDSFTEEQFAGEGLSQLGETGLRVDYLPIRLVYPDPAQPRRVLPASIYQAFYEERCTPVQALKEFIQLVQVTARQKGRPFTAVDDLLPNAEDDNEIDVGKLTPEEELLRDLVNLGMTIRDDGQVNPLTIVNRSQGVTRLYRIETGERRYWATWLMMEFLAGYQGDATLPCIIVPNERASVFRQAKENTSRSGLNAIALARQAALLILAVHDIHPPDGPVSNDFYRQALDLGLQGKSEFTTDVLAAMGGVGRARFSQYKALLNLSDDAMELADRFDLDEYRLRPVLSLPSEHHFEVVQQIIDFNLNSKQVRELCEQSDEDGGSDNEPKLPRQSVQFAKTVLTGDHRHIQEILMALLAEEDDRRVIRLRWQDFVETMNAYLETL